MRPARGSATRAVPFSTGRKRRCGSRRSHGTGRARPVGPFPAAAVLRLRTQRPVVPFRTCPAVPAGRHRRARTGPRRRRVSRREPPPLARRGPDRTIPPRRARTITPGRPDNHPRPRPRRPPAVATRHPYRRPARPPPHRGRPLNRPRHPPRHLTEPRGRLPRLHPLPRAPRRPTHHQHRRPPRHRPHQPPRHLTEPRGRFPRLRRPPHHLPPGPHGRLPRPPRRRPRRQPPRPPPPPSPGGPGPGRRRGRGSRPSRVRPRRGGRESTRNGPPTGAPTRRNRRRT